MIGISEQCVQQITEIVSDKELFGTKAFDVYDVSVLFDIAQKINYPACGITYAGIRSERNEHDQGLSSYLQVAIIFLGESKARDARRQGDPRGVITALLDKTRSQVLFDAGQPRMSPTGKPWRFLAEAPEEYKDRGLAYAQIFDTAFVGAEDGPAYYSGSGEVLISRILDDGSLEGYRSVGTVTDVILRETVESLTSKDMEVKEQSVDFHVSWGKKYILLFTMSALSESGVEFFRGDAASIDGATGASATYQIKLGYRYTLPALNTTAQVFKNQAAATLVEGKNYTWTNKAAGTFEILADQSSAVSPLVDGQTITVTYNAPEQLSVTEHDDLNEAFAVRFEGLNNVNGEPVAFEGHRAVRDHNMTRLLQSSKIDKNQQSLILVADPARNNKHYKELKL